MDKRQESMARAELRSELERVLGPSMPGVSGYGVALDRKTHRLGLNVLVDAAAVGTGLQQALPGEICGLPVRISRGGVARLE